MTITPVYTNNLTVPAVHVRGRCSVRLPAGWRARRAVDLARRPGRRARCVVGARRIIRAHPWRGAPGPLLWRDAIPPWPVANRPLDRQFVGRGLRDGRAWPVLL